MKDIIKITSLILCLLLLLSSVISCAPADVQNKEAETTQALDTTPPELTIENLTTGFTEGEYILDDSPVSPRELLTALYRIAGEPAASRDFEVVWHIGKKGSYYYDAIVWSAFQAGIVSFNVELMATDGNGAPVKLGDSLRVGARTQNEIIDETSKYFNDVKISSISIETDFETDVTRSDAVLAMYYYFTTYLSKSSASKDMLTTFDDCGEFLDAASFCYTIYDFVIGEFNLSWNWALEAGIVEPYPDNTLRPDATLTRAEFAAMLTRFMDYVK